MKTLQEETNKGINDGIDSFHFYLKETNYPTAKRLVLESTLLKPVIEYVENFYSALKYGSIVKVKDGRILKINSVDNFRKQFDYLNKNGNTVLMLLSQISQVVKY